MKNRSCVLSQGKSYKEIAEFRDEHDLADFWDQTKAADFEVDIASEIAYYSLDKSLSDRLQEMARKRGVSADTLINLWVQEKLREGKV